MKLKLDLHPIFNDSQRIEQALQAIIDEAVLNMRRRLRSYRAKALAL